ncbi:MAG: hypothetical protein ACR2RE_13485 [Geminicoccaceae bacterium]
MAKSVEGVLKLTMPPPLSFIVEASDPEALAFFEGRVDRYNRVAVQPAKRDEFSRHRRTSTYVGCGGLR